MKGSSGKYIDCNQAFENFLAVGRESIIGKTAHEIWPKAEANAYCRQDELLFQQGGLQIYEAQITSADGTHYVVQFNKRAILDENGEVAGFLGAIFDITERKARKDALARLADLNRSHERRFRELFDNSLTGIDIIQDGRLCEVNSAVCEMFGYSPEEVLGADPLSFVHPDDRESSAAFLRSMLTGENKTGRFAHRGIRKDGQTIHVEILSKAIEVNGRAAILANVIDVSASNRAKHELEDTKNFLENILQSSTRYSIIGMDLERRIVSWNEGARRNYGYSASEILGKKTETLNTPECGKSGAIKRLYDTAFEKGLAEAEVIRVRKDGSRFPAAVVVTRRDDAAGNPIGFLLISNDISERKQAEERLQEASRYARSLIEASLDPLVTISRDGKITDVNEALIKATGVPRKQLIGTDFFDYFTEPQKAREGYQQVFAKGLVTDYPLTIRHRDGGLTDVLYNASVYRDTRGNVLGVFAAARDVTEHKRAEQALRDSEARFRTLLEMAPIAVAIVRHANTIYVNRKFLETFGYEAAEERIGRSVLETYIDEDRAGILERARLRSLGMMPNTSIQATGVRKDGSRFPAQVELANVSLPDGPAGLAFILDTSERERAEQALRESEDRFRTVLEMAPYSVAIVRPANIIYVNRRFLQTFGYETAEQVLGRPIEEMYLEEHRAGIQENVRLRSQGVAMESRRELTGLRRDGSRFPAQVEIASVRLSDGPAAVGFISDITERQRAEHALRDSEALFRTLLEVAPVAVVISRDGKSVYANRKALDTFGYASAGEFEGLPLGQLFIEEARAAIEERVRLRLENTPTLDSYETVGLRKDGSPFPMQVEATTVDLQGGRATLGFATDITSRKREEAVLLEKARLQEFLNNVVSTAPGAIYTFVQNPDGTAAIPYASARYKDIMGIDPAKVREDASAAFAIIEPNDLAAVEESIARSCRDGSEWNCEFRVNHPQRGTVWVGASSIPVRQPNGDVVWHGYIADITNSKQLELQVIQAQKMEAVGQLAGGIAHDFNNVIGSILGWADICIENASGDEAQQKRLRRIKNQANLGANLTKQLLTFSRKQLLQPENISLNEVVRQAMQILESSFGHNISVTSSLDPAMHPIRGDFTQMQQVVMNLCLNARDAMPDGGKLILETRNMQIDEEYCRRQTDAKPGPYAGLFVSDTGSGMDAKTLTKIFDPFYTTKGPGKGTGLGLSVVYGLVKQHGGFIHVYSEVGVGTRFCIFLPAISTEPRAAASQRESALKRGTECILMADDHEDFREMAQEVLTELGYEVIPACNGRQALDKFVENSGRVHLMVLDVVMPEMQGTEVCDEVRKRFPRIPVILVTGYSERILEGWITGKVDVRILTKPYSAIDLAALVRELLDSNGRDEEDAAV
jgi:PAS domain S-box-containing protein